MLTPRYPDGGRLSGPLWLDYFFGFRGSVTVVFGCLTSVPFGTNRPLPASRSLRPELPRFAIGFSFAQHIRACPMCYGYCVSRVGRRRGHADTPLPYASAYLGAFTRT